MSGLFAFKANMQIIPNAKAQFIDSAGQPLSSGTVGFYFPGTLNPKATFQDMAGTIANPNPVQLDSRGQALIWGTGVYRQIVKDASGVTIWDQITEDPNAGLTGDMTDAIFVAGTDFTPGTTTVLTLPANPGSITNTWIFFDAAYQDDAQATVSGTTLTFASPIPVGVGKVTVKIGTTIAVGTPGPGTVTDASVAANAGINSTKLSYIEGDSGAVARTVQSKLKERISVKDFGAKGDGTTDDTTAVQNAINVVLNAGGILYFPAGTYKLTAAINANYSALTGTWPAPRISLIGDGPSSTILSWAHGASGGLSFIGGTTSGGIVGQYEVSGLLLAGGDTTGLGLTISTAAFVSVSNVVVENFQTGFELVDVISSNFRACRAAFCNGGLFSVFNAFSPPNALSFWDCHFTNNAQFAMDIHNPTAFTFFGGSIESNFGAGVNVFGVRILIQSGQIDGANAATFVGTYFENNGSANPGEGIADLWFNNVGAVSAMTVIGCNFNRQNQFCSNNIRIDTAGGFSSKVTVLNSSFVNFTPYVASASRPNLAVLSATDPIQLIELGNTWSTPVEAPNWSGQSSTLPASLTSPATQSTAWVVFNGTTGAIVQSFNVSSVVRNSTGNYTITYARPLQQVNNCASFGLSSPGFASFTGQSTTSITMATANTAGTATDFGEVCVNISGGYLQ